MAKRNAVPADTSGRAWAILKDVKIGDKLVADGGFTCIRRGTVLTVKSDPKHRGGGSPLFVDCSHGSHFIDGQLGEHGELVGLYPEKSK